MSVSNICSTARSLSLAGSAFIMITFHFVIAQRALIQHILYALSFSDACLSLIYLASWPAFRLQPPQMLLSHRHDRVRVEHVDGHAVL